jgi:hypothetical protein
MIVSTASGLLKLIITVGQPVKSFKTLLTYN